MCVFFYFLLFYQLVVVRYLVDVHYSVTREQRVYPAAAQLDCVGGSRLLEEAVRLVLKHQQHQHPCTYPVGVNKLELINTLGTNKQYGEKKNRKTHGGKGSGPSRLGLTHLAYANIFELINTHPVWVKYTW